MDTSYIYKNQDESSKEYLRSFITFYYYLLLNNISSHKKEFAKYYKNDKYFDFFKREFIDDHNIMIFTLYNQMPLSFLPYPTRKLYYRYPKITFYKNQEDIKKLSEKNNKIIDVNDLYHTFKKWDKDYPKSDVIENFSKKLAEGKNDNYDNFRIRINSKFIKNIPVNFIKRKLIAIYTNKLIITDNYYFNVKNEEFIINKHFSKQISDTRYNESHHRTTIKFNDINYLSVFDNITKQKVINAFSLSTIKKDAILYNQRYAWPEEGNMELFKKERYPSFFTFYNNERVHDPLKLTKNKYRISEFLLKEDTPMIDLTTNILVKNEIKGNHNTKYYGPDYRKEKKGELEDDIFRCMNKDSIKQQLQDCDINILYKFNNFEYEPNYNLKSGINLIIWKNTKYMDKSMHIPVYLANLEFYGLINNFSFLKLKDGKYERLSTEIAFLHNDKTQDRNRWASRLEQLTKYKINDKV